MVNFCMNAFSYFLFTFLFSSSIERKSEELPYHYIALKDMDGLKECLLSREMFEHMYTENNKRLLMHYWEAAGGYSLAAKSYQAALNKYTSVSMLRKKKKKKRKLHYIDPRGKFILLPQEKRQGLKCHLQDYHQKLTY